MDFENLTGEEFAALALAVVVVWTAFAYGVSWVVSKALSNREARRYQAEHPAKTKAEPSWWADSFAD